MDSAQSICSVKKQGAKQAEDADKCLIAALKEEAAQLKRVLVAREGATHVSCESPDQHENRHGYGQQQCIVIQAAPRSIGSKIFQRAPQIWLMAWL